MQYYLSLLKNMIDDLIQQGPVSGRAQSVAILGSLILLCAIIYLIRKGLLKSGYSILWFLTTGVIFLISLSGNLLLWFSDIIGVFYAPSAVFSVLIVTIIVIIIHFSVVLTKHERQITKLAQENTLLKEKLVNTKKK